MVLALVLTMVAAATPLPPMESRAFIATGATSRAAAEKALKTLKLPAELVVPAGYPRVVDSAQLPGLNPGFWLVVIGFCDDVGEWPAHNNGLAALIQRASKGAYAKPVARQSAACPLWVDSTVKRAEIAAVLKAPNEPLALTRAASALHDESDLLGADILLRRALALGATDTATRELLRTVEFVLEDAPFKLPE